MVGIRWKIYNWKVFEILTCLFVNVCRMYPPELLTRRVIQSFTLDGHVIPVETLIDIDLFSLHRNPLYWELPDKFMPERFIEGCGKHLYQYLPFSTGHRMCPAKKFMMTMIKTVVITFVERVKIRTVNNENQELNGTYIEVRPTSA